MADNLISESNFKYFPLLYSISQHIKNFNKQFRQRYNELHPCQRLLDKPALFVSVK